MQIAVPYASYQPYLPSSNADIRVEMFNGRKKELAEIESPVGANIIYGGRQLGKSAILKMAAVNWTMTRMGTVRYWWTSA